MFVVKLDRPDIIQVIPNNHLLIADDRDLPDLLGIEPADMNVRQNIIGIFKSGKGQIFQRLP